MQHVAHRRSDEIHQLRAEIERLRAALAWVNQVTPAAERERCARHIELIAADWREAGADQKVWASEYLARQIRELGDVEQTEHGLSGADGQ